MEQIIDFSKESDKKRLYYILKNLKETKYRVSIKQFRKQRSVPQNKYYWGVIIDILCKELGWFPDEMHDYLKRKFMPKEKVIKATGERIIIGGSTTELDTADAEIYYEKVRIWALSELDVLIPLPGEWVDVSP